MKSLDTLALMCWFDLQLHFNLYEGPRRGASQGRIPIEDASASQMRLKWLNANTVAAPSRNVKVKHMQKFSWGWRTFYWWTKLLEGPIPPLVLLRHHNEGVLSATWSQYANSFPTIPVASLLGILPPKSCLFLFVQRKRSRDVNSMTGNVILLQLSPVLLCMCIWNTHDCDWLYAAGASSSSLPACIPRPKARTAGRMWLF